MRQQIQQFGRTLSGMVMPNIGAFIAWGFITALFIPEGWWPNGQLAQLVGPMLTYLLPLLIAYTAGRNVAGERGGVIGAIAAVGVIVGSDIPMFIGAMIMGPLAGYAIRRVRPHGRGAREGRLRNARQQLLDRHSRHAAGSSGLLCRRQRGHRPDDAHKQRCRAGHTPRTAASCVAFRGAGQGAVSQQRRQSRNLLCRSASNRPAKPGAVDHVPARNQPRSRIGRTARILGFSAGEMRASRLREP